MPEEKKNLNKEFYKLLREKEERIKELACINGTTKILNESKSVGNALQQVVQILPQAWQYPEQTSARIVFEKESFISTNFIEGEWRMEKEFSTIGESFGVIEIFCSKNNPEDNGDPFLNEERDLIGNIASIISGFINSIKAREILGIKNFEETDGDSHEEVSGTSLLNRFLRRYNATNDSLLYRFNYIRIKEILLVASLYDAYAIEGEEKLITNILNEFRHFDFSTPPRITWATNLGETLERLRLRDYDLVIFIIGSQRETQSEICNKIKETYPSIPSCLLLTNPADIHYFANRKDQETKYDTLFTWTGNATVFLSMVTLLEDKINFDRDFKKGFTRAILLVEDSPEHYSTIIPILYGLIMEQTKSLIAEGVSGDTKMIKLRTRPKILLATNWEDASSILEQYSDVLMAVISDISFPKDGKMDSTAGYNFLLGIKTNYPWIPILAQSLDYENIKFAQQLKCPFINKNSRQIVNELKNFITHNLGFSPFQFRDDEKRNFGTANNMAEFESLLATVPVHSIVYHATRNHFSIWLMARGEIQIAKLINFRQYSEKDDPSEIRGFLLESIKSYKHKQNRGRLISFNENSMLDETSVLSLIPGSLGGKGRGLAFINSLVYNLGLGELLPEINIKTPVTSIIGTDEFDAFMETNKLWEIVKEESDYDTIQRCFLEGKLSDTLENELKILLKYINKPIAVRSSSQFENSFSRPFSGIFKTYILPNNQDDPEVRLKYLTDAIKLVYASIYSKLSRNYFDAINLKIEFEKMAVAIQEVVGNRYDDIYYPHISGTAQSYNFYPVAHIKPEDGFAVVALGMGQYVVEAGKSYRFCPKYPNIDVVSQTDIFKFSQVNFFAVDLSNKDLDLKKGENAGLVSLEISVAEKQDTLKHLASVYNRENDILIPGLDYPGPRVINFANILKHDYIPLASTIHTILDIVSEATGNPSEIEFAVDLNKDKEGRASFYILQIKPLSGSNIGYNIDPESIDFDNLLLLSEKSMGNGIIDDICDVIYIVPENFDKMRTIDIAEEIENFNDIMIRENRKYILIGPGRWGSRDVFLGIPVLWSAISKAKVIVEIGLPDFNPDASLGSHFFNNVTSMNIGYFSVNKETSSGIINWELFDEKYIVKKGKYINHIRFDQPLMVRMDGKKGMAVITVNKDKTVGNIQPSFNQRIDMPSEQPL
jgi:hypothetical protein